MQGASQKRHVPPDGLSACQPADGLVYHRLEDRRGEVFLGSAVIDQRLDVRLSEYAAPGGNGIEGMIIPGILIQARSICLKEGCHLIYERTGSAGADTVHTLFNISPFEVDDLRVLAA